MGEGFGDDAGFPRGLADEDFGLGILPLDWGSLPAARRPGGSVVGIEPGEQFVGALERRRCDGLRRDALVYLQPDG
jgi:hypothetical protein